MLLITPEYFLLWHVKLSAVKSVYLNLIYSQETTQDSSPLTSSLLYTVG